MKVPELKEEERRAFDSMLLSGSYDPEKTAGPGLPGCFRG